MKNTYQDKRNEKLVRVCKFLLIFHQELQSCSKKLLNELKGKKMEMGNETSKSIWIIKGQDC